MFWEKRRSCRYNTVFPILLSPVRTESFESNPFLSVITLDFTSFCEKWQKLLDLLQKIKYNILCLFFGGQVCVDQKTMKKRKDLLFLQYA